MFSFSQSSIGVKRSTFGLAAKTPVPILMFGLFNDVHGCIVGNSDLIGIVQKSFTDEQILVFIAGRPDSTHLAHFQNSKELTFF